MSERTPAGFERTRHPVRDFDLAQGVGPVANPGQRFGDGCPRRFGAAG